MDDYRATQAAEDANLPPTTQPIWQPSQQARTVQDVQIALHGQTSHQAQHPPAQPPPAGSFFPAWPFIWPSAPVQTEQLDPVSLPQSTTMEPPEPQPATMVHSQQQPTPMAPQPQPTTMVPPQPQRTTMPPQPQPTTMVPQPQPTTMPPQEQPTTMVPRQSQPTPMAPPPARVFPRPYSGFVPENLRTSRPTYFPLQSTPPKTVNPADTQKSVTPEPPFATGSGGILRQIRSKQEQGQQGTSGIGIQGTSGDMPQAEKHSTNPEQSTKKRKQEELSLPQFEEEMEEDWQEVILPADDGTTPRSRRDIERELTLREQNLDVGYARRERLLNAVMRLHRPIQVEESRIEFLKKELAATPI